MELSVRGGEMGAVAIGGDGRSVVWADRAGAVYRGSVRLLGRVSLLGLALAVVAFVDTSGWMLRRAAVGEFGGGFLSPVAGRLIGVAVGAVVVCGLVAGASWALMCWWRARD